MESLLAPVHDILDGYRLILASGSPRRKMLLNELGLKFETVQRDYTETFPDGLNGREIAEYVSGQKAGSFRGQLSGREIVITADTIVWCDGKVLGKPGSYDQAVKMLAGISGNTHEVITGVTFLSAAAEKTFSVTSKVTFDTLSTEEIEYYVSVYKPYDKAGAYGIQEWIGLIGCSSIEGSYFNVVGLPVHTLYRELIKFISETGI